MKTKELSKQVRDKVVEKYRTGLSYKKISETLNIPWSTIKSIIKMAPQQTCQEKAAHQNHARRALIREATKRPKKTLKELQSSTAEIGVSVHRTTLSCTLHRAGLYGRVSRKKPLLKEKKKKLSFLAIKDNAMWTGKLVRIEGMMEGATYRLILEGILFQSSRDLRLESRFTFQQDNDPKQTLKATLE